MSQDTESHAPNLRLLKAIVIILGGLTLLALAVLVTTIVWRVSAPSAPSQPVTGAPVVALTLPAGATVSHMAIDGDRIVLHLTGASEQILVLDAGSGAILQRIDVARAP